MATAGRKLERLTLLACITGAIAVFVDGSVIFVALPAIQSDLGGGLAAQQWIVNAYAVTLGALILIGGSLGDLLGRRRVFTVGLIGFGVASLLCALAPSSGFLIGARAFQGLAGALLVPITLAVIVATFKGRSRGKAIGTWTAWTGIAFIIGPLIGGLLVETLSWRWVFFINLPIIAGTLYLVRHLSPTLDKRREVPIDFLGGALVATGLAAVVWGLIEQPNLGWSDWRIAGSLIVGAILLVSFIWHQHRAKHPMMPLGLFRNRNFAAANAATLLVYGGLSASFFLIVLYLQQVAGYSPFFSGLALLPVTLLLFILSPRFGALSAQYGPRLFMAAGPLIAAVGLAWLLTIQADVPYVSVVLPSVLLIGLGLALTVAPLTTTVLSDVDESHAGLASGINNAISRVAALLAIAAIGAVVALSFSGSLGDEPRAGVTPDDLAAAKEQPLVIEPPADAPSLAPDLTDASVEAFRIGILLSALLLAGGGVLSAVAIRNPRRSRT